MILCLTFVLYIKADDERLEDFYTTIPIWKIKYSLLVYNDL